MKSASIIASVLLLAMMTAGCKDNDLENVSKGLLVTAESIGVLQQTVIEAEKLGVISTQDTASILTLSIKVNEAGKDAVAITRAISKLDQPNKEAILKILIPVIKAVDDCVANGLAGIKNEQTKQKIRGILLGIQSALNAIQLTLGGS